MIGFIFRLISTFEFAAVLICAAYLLYQYSEWFRFVVAELLCGIDATKPASDNCESQENASSQHILEGGSHRGTSQTLVIDYAYLSSGISRYVDAEPSSFSTPISASDSGMTKDPTIGDRMDPFASLENLRSKETNAWLQKQVSVADDYFTQVACVSQTRNEFFARFQSCSASLEYVSAPFVRGHGYFFFKKVHSKKHQFSLYTKRSLYADAKLVLDPSSVALSIQSIYMQRAYLGSESSSGTTSADSSSSSAPRGETLTQEILSSNRDAIGAADGIINTVPQVDGGAVDRDLKTLCAAFGRGAVPIVHATWVSEDGMKLAYGFSLIDSTYSPTVPPPYSLETPHTQRASSVPPPAGDDGATADSGAAVWTAPAEETNHSATMTIHIRNVSTVMNVHASPVVAAAPGYGGPGLGSWGLSHSPGSKTQSGDSAIGGGLIVDTGTSPTAMTVGASSAEGGIRRKKSGQGIVGIGTSVLGSGSGPGGEREGGGGPEQIENEFITGCQIHSTSIAWLDRRGGFFYNKEVPFTRVYHSSNINFDISENTNSSSYTTSKETVVGGAAPQEKDEDTAKGEEDWEIEEEMVMHRVYFHRLGTSEEADFVVFEQMSEPGMMSINIKVSVDGRYLIVDLFSNLTELSGNTLHRPAVSENCAVFPGNKVYYFDISRFDGVNAASVGKCFRLIDTFAFRFEYITNIEEFVWFRTNFRAPNFRVVRVTLPEYSPASASSSPMRMSLTSNGLSDITSSRATSSYGNKDDASAAAAAFAAQEEEVDHEFQYQLLDAWKSALDWIPEAENGEFLELAGIAAHTVLVLKYLHGFTHEVLLYDLTQTLEEESRIPVADLPHPSFGTITGPHCSFHSPEVFYHYSDFHDPGSIFKAEILRDPSSGSIEIAFDQLHLSSVPPGHSYDKACALQANAANANAAAASHGAMVSDGIRVVSSTGADGGQGLASQCGDTRAAQRTQSSESVNFDSVTPRSERLLRRGPTRASIETASATPAATATTAGGGASTGPQAGAGILSPLIISPLAVTAPSASSSAAVSSASSTAGAPPAVSASASPSAALGHSTPPRSGSAAVAGSLSPEESPARERQCPRFLETVEDYCINEGDNHITVPYLVFQPVEDFASPVTSSRSRSRSRKPSPKHKDMSVPYSSSLCSSSPTFRSIGKCVGVRYEKGDVSLMNGRAEGVDTNADSADLVVAAEGASAASAVKKGEKVEEEDGSEDEDESEEETAEGADMGRPCLMCTHASFGVPAVPVFSLALYLFVKHCGGIVVCVDLPGGGNQSHSWHSRARGSAQKRQIAVNSLLTVARDLVAKGLTTHRKLGLYGGGAGSAVVFSACITQCPELFGAAVFSDGVFDLVNYPRWNNGEYRPSPPPPPPISTSTGDVSSAHGGNTGGESEGRSASPPNSPHTVRARKRTSSGGGGGLIKTALHYDLERLTKNGEKSSWGLEFGVGTDEVDLGLGAGISASENEKPSPPNGFASSMSAEGHLSAALAAAVVDGTLMVALKQLRELSPLHNLSTRWMKKASAFRESSGTKAVSHFPAVLLHVSGISERVDRNVASCRHSLKFLAELQSCVASLCAQQQQYCSHSSRKKTSKPFLLRIRGIRTADNIPDSGGSSSSNLPASSSIDGTVAVIEIQPSASEPSTSHSTHSLRSTAAGSAVSSTTTDTADPSPDNTWTAAQLIESVGAALSASNIISLRDAWRSGAAGADYGVLFGKGGRFSSDLLLSIVEMLGPMICRSSYTLIRQVVMYGIDESTSAGEVGVGVSAGGVRLGGVRDGGEREGIGRGRGESSSGDGDCVGRGSGIHRTVEGEGPSGRTSSTVYHHHSNNNHSSSSSGCRSVDAEGFTPGLPQCSEKADGSQQQGAVWVTKQQAGAMGRLDGVPAGLRSLSNGFDPDADALMTAEPAHQLADTFSFLVANLHAKWVQDD